MEYIIFYLLGISFFSVLITCADKWLAKNDGIRISEKTLFFMSVIGGSVSMYITMLIIRHKTKKKKFMVGLPLIFALQIAVVIVYSIYL